MPGVLTPNPNAALSARRALDAPPRGVSLVEVLVTIGVIGIVFSIAFPALMRAKSAAGEVKSLSQARDNARLIDAYVDARDGRYPIVKAGEPVPLNARGIGVIVNGDPPARWWTSRRWPGLLDDPAIFNVRASLLISPGADIEARTEDAIATSYVFSSSFVAGWELWGADYDGDPSVLRTVMRAEVQHPTRKAMVWDAEMAYVPAALRDRIRDGRQPAPIAFADLHGEVRRRHDAAPPVPNVLNELPWREVPLHNTPSGVRGRDY